MSDILHEIHIKAPAETVYRALATVPGLAGWWTATTSGHSEPGGTLEFRFGQHAIEMRVDALEPGQRVAWACTRDASDWLGTKLTFDLTEADGRTTLVFGHRAWKQANAYFAHCSMKWATFLLSLRDYVETGAGRPFPHDLRI